MTVGQWMLTFFWDNSDLLEGLNKWGGVAMAIIGAALTVPYAVRHSIRSMVERVRTFAATVQAGVKELIRRLRCQPKEVQSDFGSEGNLGAVGHDPSVHISDPWPTDGSIDDKHTWIRSELQRIERRHQDHIENNERVISHLKGLHKGTRKTIEEMQTEMKAQEAAAITIDTIGLLPILSGIILTGVPEELSKTGVFGWCLLIGASAITIRAMRRSKTSGVWKAELK
ncbi:hypothetical protein [Arthrobacter sp. OY3WO11]|uniref:hypothetical protein n=1 Tax=Arthrobacter sp. OY3WO11 TaxID=1835723 RepID=UPI000A4E9442|nr:hypothetical protein [Arthrobacter sp. OY3WO11]